jgi:hypothetical protein
VTGRDEAAALVSLSGVRTDNEQERTPAPEMPTGDGDVDRPGELLGRVVPALWLNDDDQHGLAGGLVGNDHDGVGQKLDRHSLTQVGGTKRDGDLSGKVRVGHGPQQLDRQAGILADQLDGSFMGNGGHEVTLRRRTDFFGNESIDV